VKLRKIVHEEEATVMHNGTGYTTNITTTTDYIGGMVYERKVYSNGNLSALGYSPRLQFIGHEEGRVRPVEDNNTISFVYDYFIKDHLGNIRMVLTEEEKQHQYPPASMETAPSSLEEALYANVDITRTNLPVDYPTDNYTTPNEKVSELKGSSHPVGPSITLKVMSGDKVNIHVSSWYRTNSQSPGQPVNILSSLLSSITTGISGALPNHHNGVTAIDLQNTGIFGTTVTDFINEHQQGDVTRPKAYLNWILLDEQFNYVESGSGAEQVPAESVFGTAPNNEVYRHVLTDLPVTSNGYLYVYVSNETPNIAVYFDNLQVTHTPGALLEENHYYPFGLVMSGISSKAAGSLANKHLYSGKELNNKEFSDGSGSELYDFGARMYDPQIGRWHVVDPMADLYFATSPYGYALNQPTNAIDPDGNLVIFINGNHFGDGGSSDYWRKTETYVAFTQQYWDRQGRIHERSIYAQRELAFDKSVMTQLNDQNAKYYDGSGGGWHPFNESKRLSSSATGRMILGYNQGKKDVAGIIANLARDKSGNIVETIKIITHSMGGAYGKGLIAALKDYISTLPAEQQRQIRISFVADFDPYQGGDMTADGETPTFQFIHYGWLANEKENGKVEQRPSNSNSTAHSIFSFFADISQLQEGTYIWNEETQTWDLQH
jgi:RHS repeat-associated protein